MWNWSSVRRGPGYKTLPVATGDNTAPKFKYETQFVDPAFWSCVPSLPRTRTATVAYAPPGQADLRLTMCPSIRNTKTQRQDSPLRGLSKKVTHGRGWVGQRLRTGACTKLTSKKEQMSLGTVTTPEVSPSRKCPQPQPQHVVRETHIQEPSCPDHHVLAVQALQVIQERLRRIIIATSEQFTAQTVSAASSTRPLSTQELQRVREHGCRVLAQLSCCIPVSTRTLSHSMLLWFTFLDRALDSCTSSLATGARHTNGNGSTYLGLVVPMACFQVACKISESFAPRSSDLVYLEKAGWFAFDDECGGIQAAVSPCSSTSLLLQEEHNLLFALEWDVTMTSSLDQVEHLFDSHPDLDHDKISKLFVQALSTFPLVASESLPMTEESFAKGK